MSISFSEKLVRQFFFFLYLKILRKNVDDIAGNYSNKFSIKPECICCHTIVCSWVPTFTIDSVLDEYKEYYDRYEILLMMQKFYNKQFFDDLVYEQIFLYIYI